MSSKIKSFILILALSLSFISYKESNVTAQTYDVAEAIGPVKFKFTLTESYNMISANVPYNLNHRGKDVYLVIIDTGIEKAHPFFQDRVALEACFSSRCPNKSNEMIGPGAAVPTHWHGTHVAGIAAGYNSQFKGIASESKIIAINVFDPYGAAYDSDIIKALNWVASISEQYNISSVNMSLGGSTTFTSTCDNYLPSMTSAIKNLRDKDIATIVSSGNGYAYGMSAPACISHAVSVAATYKTSDAIADFSNVSRYTTLSAPGVAISSSKLLGSYGSASGTSMSSPFVTGAFAVYRSAFGKQSVSKVVDDFKTYSKPSKDSYTNIEIPRIDFLSMFQSPITTTTTTPVVTTSTSLPDQPTTTTSTIAPPSVVTTTTTTLFVPPPAKLPFIPKPLLLELNGLAKSYVWIKYRDPYMNKSFISYYELSCNNSQKYSIPFQTMYSLHSYKLQVPASSINSCTLAGITIYGTKTSSSSLISIYPKNKLTSSYSIKSKVKSKTK